MTITRIVAAETLDHLPADDPAARRSRRDLVRVHRAMGTRSISARGWHELLSPDRAGAPLQILELGAGDGRLTLEVARALAPGWPRVQLTLMDRQNLVTPATVSAFAELGWTAHVRAVDVLEWAAGPIGEAADGPSSPWDLITAHLFLHHFGAGELERLLAAAASRCLCFFACEPSRSWRALAGSHLVGLIGANAVTRHDAVLSVHAGFRQHEISALWPRTDGPWRLREVDAGLFSHSFSAQRSRAGR